MKVNAITISKIAISLTLYNLYCHYSIFGSYINHGTLIFTLLAVGSFLVAVNGEDVNLVLPKELQFWIAFIVCAFATSFFAKVSVSTSLSTTYNVLERTVFSIIIYYICKKEKSIQFPVKLILGIAIIISIYILTSGIQDISRLRLSSSVGPNGLANIMFVAIFCLFYLKTDKILFCVLRYAFAAIFIYIIMLTGSRKSLIAVGILLAVYLGYKYFIDSRESLSLNTILQLLFIAILIGIVIYKNMDLIQNTMAYERIFGSYAERAMESDETRLKYYQKAISDFFGSPIWGIGMGNFQLLHGSYTHSTYVEPIVSTGIFSVLYYIPYFMVLKKIITLLKTRWNHMLNRDDIYYIFAFFTAFLFVGAGIGYMGHIMGTLEFAIILAAVDNLLEKADCITERNNMDEVQKSTEKF